jgi:hypothetical protein
VTGDAILAAAKLEPEVYLSPVVGGLESKFQQFFRGFAGGPTQRKWFRQCHVTGDVILLTVRPEVYLSTVVGELDSKFQMFWGFSRRPNSTEVVPTMSRDW